MDAIYKEIVENVEYCESETLIYQGFKGRVANLKSVACKGVPVRVRPVALFVE
jgi:hypothetical protein